MKFGPGLPWMVAITLLAMPARGQTIQAVTPFAVAPGQTTEVTLRGAKLEQATRVWTSFPAEATLAPREGDASGPLVRIQIKVDEHTPPQIGGLIVSTPEGASDPVFLVIDDLPTVVDNGQNRAFAQAQEISLPVAVDGVTDGTAADYYRFTAAPGQRLAVEVLAARLGSPLDPILQLLDAQGRELAAADDDASLGADGRFVYTFAQEGTYYLTVRDVRYRGGENFKYRLRLGDFPLVSTSYPLGVAAETGGEVAASGPEEERAALAVAVAPGAVSPRQAVAFKFANDGASGFATLVASPHPQVVEVEPNDTPETATRVTLPCGINGRFETAKDRDQFVFDAQAGSSLLFRPVTRSIGSPCYLRLAVYKPDGGLLAEAPITDTDEPSLVVQIPADGTYRLVVEELLRRGGPEFAWHVEAQHFAGVSLQTKPDKNTPHKFALPQNGAIALEVQATRQGYDGPITLALEPAASGFHLLNGVIGEKQAATRVLIVPPADAAPGDLAALRIVGAVTRNEQSFHVPVATAALLRLKTPHLVYPPAWLDGLIPVAITAAAPELFTITPSAASLLYPRSAAQIGLTLTMDRKQAEFKDPLLVLGENLPSGLSAEVKREGNGPQEKYQVTLKAPPALADGRHELRFACFGEFKGQGRLLNVTIPLTIIAPLTVAAAPAGPISPGQSQQVTLTVARFAAEEGVLDPQPVTLRFQQLPSGVTAPAEIVLAADQTEVTVELMAAADAAVGPFEGLVVAATTKFQNHEVSAESPPVRWEVK